MAYTSNIQNNGYPQKGAAEGPHSPHANYQAATYDQAGYGGSGPATGRPILNGPAAHDQDFAKSGLSDQELVQGVPLYDTCNHEAARRFVKTGYRDVWALILFSLMLAVSCGFAIHNGKDVLNDYNSERLSSDGRKTLDVFKTWLPASFALSWAMSLLVLAAMRAFTRQFIIIANVLVILLNVALAVYAISQKVYAIAVLWGLVAVLNAVWLYLVRRRIPLATVLLRQSVVLICRQWGTIVFTWMCLFAGAAYYCVWTFMVAPLAADGSDSEVAGWVYPATLGALLALLWATQVFANVAHVTTSGVVATWYFLGDAAMPTSPTPASARRAMTTSLGSICFGSLLVAVLKLIYYMVRSATRHQNAFVRCIALCVIGILESLMEYFNIYAFTHVAIYGSSYITAAKQTWAMIKECGWSAYFNDCLVWPVLSMVTFFPALFLAVAIGLATQNVIVGIVVFLVCYIVLMMLMRPIYSGVVTQFVCIAECTDVMTSTNPEYYAAVEEAIAALNEPTC